MCRRLTASADETLGFLVTRCCAALMSAGTRALIGEMLQAAVAQLEGGTHVFGDVIAKMATAAGRRMAPLVPELVPRLVVLLDAEDEEEGASERQAGALAAIAAIVAGCPKQCKGAEFTPAALEKASELLSLSDGGGDLFDFSGDDDDDEDDDEDDEDEVYGDDGDETDDAEFDDDEDQTWKVRSAAAKCVAAIGMLPGMDASAEVVSSLIERVEHESSTA